jgi:glycosyltransferase involved in cell wall biosynthesis
MATVSLHAMEAGIQRDETFSRPRLHLGDAPGSTIGGASAPTRPSFLDPFNRGSGLTLVLEQSAVLGGMERIAAVAAARWPDAQVVAARFLGEEGADVFPAARFVDLPGRRRHFLAPLHARRLERAGVLDGEVVLALHSSGWALGPRAAPSCSVVAFTNGLPRWTGPMAPFYMRDFGRPTRAALLAARPLMRAHQRRLRRRADLLLACSRFAASTLPEPAQVVYPPVNVSFFAGDGDPDGHVIAVGRLVAHKRFDVLLRALRGRPERLVVVGIGPELPALRRAAPPNVMFTGAVTDDELASLLRGARALVHPTVEDFGIVMGEALAAGVPVIAPRAGGAVEIVRGARAGHLLDTVTPAAIGKALDTLVHDPRACRAAAAAFAPERFISQLGAALDAVRRPAASPPLAA